MLKSLTCKLSEVVLTSMVLSSTFTDKVEVEPKSISLPVDDKADPGTTVTESWTSLSFDIDPESCELVIVPLKELVG